MRVGKIRKIDETARTPPRCTARAQVAGGGPAKHVSVVDNPGITLNHPEAAPRIPPEPTEAGSSNPHDGLELLRSSHGKHPEHNRRTVKHQLRGLLRPILPVEEDVDRRHPPVCRGAVRARRATRGGGAGEHGRQHRHSAGLGEAEVAQGVAHRHHRFGKEEAVHVDDRPPRFQRSVRNAQTLRPRVGHHRQRRRNVGEDRRDIVDVRKRRAVVLSVEGDAKRHRAGELRVKPGGGGHGDAAEERLVDDGGGAPAVRTGVSKLAAHIRGDRRVEPEAVNADGAATSAGSAEREDGGEGREADRALGAKRGAGCGVCARELKDDLQGRSRCSNLAVHCK